jgi:IS1 family transposase
MRATSRVANVSINSVVKLLVEAGAVCTEYHDRTVQADEIWSFAYAKQKNVPRAQAAPPVAGDIWTWTAIDPDTKLMVSWLVGGRDAGYALAFMDDLRSRLAHRVQLTTDGHVAYLEAVEGAFGGDVDYAQLVKIYGPAPDADLKQRISGHCIGARRTPIVGNPDYDEVNTSIVERQNLNIRMGIRRFTRDTNAFTKKVENHCHALALYFFYYNFIRIHSTLKVTPAMASGLASTPYSFEDVIAMIDANRSPSKRGPYKKRRKRKS